MTFAMDRPLTLALTLTMVEALLRVPCVALSRTWVVAAAPYSSRSCQRLRTRQLHPLLLKAPQMMLRSMTTALVAQAHRESNFVSAAAPLRH